ncbi:hypothetical protein HDU91_004344, partial [Kappamyces sp. JEL0680]
MNEPASSSALFLRSLTLSWSKKESIDLLTYLDAVLKWNSSYLQEVMTVYATSLYGEHSAPLQDIKPAAQRDVERSELAKASHRL